MISGGGRGGVRVQQPLRRWQEQRLRAQARIRRLRHFPVFQFLSRPLQCCTLSLSSVWYSAYSASCVWAQRRAQLFIGPGFRKGLGLLLFHPDVYVFIVP